MARIYIEPEKARRAALDEQTLEKKLTKLSGEVDSVKRNLRYKIAGREQISEQLRQVVEQIARESTSTKNLSDAMYRIVTQYVNTENGNRDSEVADKTSVQSVSATPIAGWEPFDWGKLGEKMLKAGLGPFGIAVSIPGLADGKPGDLAKFLSDGVGSLAKVAGAKGDTNVAWLKDLFGIAKKDIKPFKETFLGKMFGDGTPAKTVGAVASWGTNLIDSIVKNNEEFGGKWCARAVEETIAETGLKVVEGAAVTASIASLTGGILTGVGLSAACPPVLIGVAAAGVGVALDWALDGVVSWATGGSCTSWVEGASDFICTGVDWVRDQIGSAVQKTGEVINDVKDAVVEGFNNVKDGVKNVAEGIGNFFSGSCRWIGSLF